MRNYTMPDTKLSDWDRYYSMLSKSKASHVVTIEKLISSYCWHHLMQEDEYYNKYVKGAFNATYDQ